MNKEKRGVLVITSTYPRWQDDNEPPFVHELSRRLTDEWEVHVLAPHTVGAAVFEELDGVVVHRFRYCFERCENMAYEGGMLTRLRQNPLRLLLIPFFFMAQYLAALRIMQRYSINIIHAHWLIPQGITAVALKMIMRKPISVLCTSHGADLFSLRGRVAAAIKRMIFQKCDSSTVVSHAMRKEAERLGADPEQMSVVPMGVDMTTSFVPDPKKREQDTVVFVGRLVEKKGVSYLLEAFSLALKERAGLRLLIAGAGPEEDILKNLTLKLGITNSVEFLGAVKNSELPAIYQRGAIAVLPFVVAEDGDQEGFGLVVVESLGCGCAVVASEVPAVKDIITNGETGILVPQKNPQQLASVIIKLYKDPELRSQLAQRGHTYVMERFGWGSVAKRYSNLLKSLTGE